MKLAHEARALLGEGDNFTQTAAVYLTLVWCLREMRRYREAIAAAEEGLAADARRRARALGHRDRGGAHRRGKGEVLSARFRFRYVEVVRFRDLDSLGHVNNAVYLTYFESARIAYWLHTTKRTGLRRAGHDPRPRGDRLPLAPRLRRVGRDLGGRHFAGRSSFVLESDMHERASGRLVAGSRKVLVYFDYAAGKSAPIPDGLRALILAQDPEARPAV
jgi:acyl-CoA thioester hydrolase